MDTTAHSAAQARVVNAALGLFAEHGVNGTSLQMIADAIGVTKAAVYHQFQSKEEIVVATAERELARLDAAVTAAEAETDRARALDVLLGEVVDLAVERRHVVSTLMHDPVVVRLLATHEPFPQLMARVSRVLMGDDVTAEARVRAAMTQIAIGGAVSHPLVGGLDDDTLRAELREMAQRLYGSPAER
ncbi:MAG: helix-turn-helix domain-containing protein [Ilumatobacteraceae bacterium]